MGYSPKKVVDAISLLPVLKRKAVTQEVFSQRAANSGLDRQLPNYGDDAAVILNGKDITAQV
jgi:selenophosphate synthetase-related protein